jgi:sulfonate transport system permease protein
MTQRKREVFATGAAAVVTGAIASESVEARARHLQTKVKTKHDTESAESTPSQRRTMKLQRSSTSQLAPSTARLVAYRMLSWGTPLVSLLVWELASRTGLLQSSVLPAPSGVFITASTLIRSGELQTHLLASLHRAALGFAIGALTGLILGVLVGLSRFADALLDRSIQIARAVPFLAIIPLVIVWLGVGESSKVLLIALGSTFPIYLNTSLGIRQVDPKLLEMSRLMGLQGLELIALAVLPGALPSILTGVRLAMTTSWLALVVAETVGASAGLGFLAMNAREFLQTDVIVLVIFLYAAIGLASDQVARLLERRLLAWHTNYAKARA